jgi:hypothetical protein
LTVSVGRQVNSSFSSVYCFQIKLCCRAPVIVDLINAADEPYHTL